MIIGGKCQFKSSSKVIWLMAAVGTHVSANFYNIDPENSFEFFPPKDGGAVRPSAFLERSLPANLFPRYAATFFSDFA